MTAVDPDAGAILVPDYGSTWIEERAGLRPKTVSIYRGLLRCHIAPHLATITVDGASEGSEQPFLSSRPAS